MPNGAGITALWLDSMSWERPSAAEAESTHTHLVKQLREWRASGDRIVLFMDHNEHVIKGQLGKTLADKDRLNLQEAVLSCIGASPGATFF